MFHQFPTVVDGDGPLREDVCALRDELVARIDTIGPNRSKVRTWKRAAITNGHSLGFTRLVKGGLGNRLASK